MESVRGGVSAAANVHAQKVGTITRPELPLGSRIRCLCTSTVTSLSHETEDTPRFSFLASTLKKGSPASSQQGRARR